MTPKEYCYDKVAKPGSELFYATKKIPSEKRDAVIALHAFYQEIESIALNTDTLAPTKLNWWRGEIIKIQDGKPDHPVAIFLQNALPNFSLYTARVLEIIDAWEYALSVILFEKFEDVMTHIIRTAGAREAMIAEILQNQNVSTENIYSFSFIIEMTHYIQHLHSYVREEIFYFSEDELQRFQVTAQELQKYKTTENIKTLLLFQIEKIKNAYEKNAITKPKTIYEKYMKSRLKVALAVLQAIESSNYSTLENFIDITPLKKWWLSRAP